MVAKTHKPELRKFLSRISTTDFWMKYLCALSIRLLGSKQHDFSGHTQLVL